MLVPLFNRPLHASTRRTSSKTAPSTLLLLPMLLPLPLLLLLPLRLLLQLMVIHPIHRTDSLASQCQCQCKVPV